MTPPTPLQVVAAAVATVGAYVEYSRTPTGADRMDMILRRPPTVAQHARILAALAALPVKAEYGHTSDGAHGTLWAEVGP